MSHETRRKLGLIFAAAMLVVISAMVMDVRSALGVFLLLMSVEAWRRI